MRHTTECACEGVSKEGKPTLNVAGATLWAGVFNWMKREQEEAG